MISIVVDSVSTRGLRSGTLSLGSGARGGNPRVLQSHRHLPCRTVGRKRGGREGVGLKPGGEDEFVIGPEPPRPRNPSVPPRLCRGCRGKCWTRKVGRFCVVGLHPDPSPTVEGHTSSGMSTTRHLRRTLGGEPPNPRDCPYSGPRETGVGWSRIWILPSES